MDNVNKEDYYIYKKIDKQRLRYAVVVDKEKVKNLAKNAAIVATLVAMMAGGIALTARAIKIEDESNKTQIQSLIDKQKQNEAQAIAGQEENKVYNMSLDEMRAKGYSEEYIEQIQIEKMLNKPTDEDDNFSSNGIGRS